MAAIGLRVTHKEIFYSIVDIEEDEYKIISVSNVKVPKALDEPCKLSFIRNTFETIIRQYKIKRAGIKLIERNARISPSSDTFFRNNIEGVILELFANSQVEKYLLGVAPNIASILNIKPKKVKEMTEDIGIGHTTKTDDGRNLKDENKESLVVAVAALKQE